MSSAVRAALEEQLGRTLKFQHRFAEALERLDEAKTLLPQDAATDLRRIEDTRANILQHMGRFDDAAGVYDSMLAADPLDMEAHLQLNEILYRLNRDEQFLRSYDVAAERIPGNPLPQITKGKFLLKANRIEEAREKFLQALKISPDHSAALAGLARSLENLRDIESASAAHARNLEIHPENADALEDYSSFLLRQDDPRKAITLADTAHRIQPNNQSTLAVLGLCYRALGDEREQALNNYDAFVQVFDLQPPSGYADMESFNRDLAAYLHGLHGDKREYFTQTVRGGTRLFDEVFHNGHKLVDRLRPKIIEAVTTYVARLTGPDGHPFLSRRGWGFRYAGSWSSRLNDCGFHTNHVHTNGWISACYYVAIPDVVEDRAQQQGWIKFGEPTADFGPNFTPRHSVQPKPGRLVLFPSYMWHGTLPFHSPQSRTTIAFDLVPQS